MNYRMIALNTIAWAVVGVLLVAPSRADDPADASVKPQDANRAADLDGRTSGTSIRASQLIGMNIENSAEESVGEINDLVIDAREREIRYVAVTYGGFLGIGDEMHAVPFEAFKFKADPDDPADTVLVLNVTQEQMKGAKGFNENTWPNFADDKFTRSIDRQYRINRTQGSDRKTESSESRDADGDLRPLTRRNQQDDAARTGKLDEKTTGTNIRASHLIGLNIENSAKKNVGTINDIVVNARDGQVLYAAVSYGGFLGIGDELHAVPFESFKFKTDPDEASETVLVLNVTQEQVEGAKGFDESNWPDFADENFTREIDKRYGIERKHVGKLVSITGDKLVMANKEGEEHSHTLTADAKITCDGTVCKAKDLKVGTKIRVTTLAGDAKVATRIEAIDKNESLADTHDGKVVSITGNKLVMTNTQGKEEHTCTLSADVKVTCDGEVCKPSDLKPGMRVRVTSESDALHSANWIEALDKNADFAACDGESR